MRSGRTIFTLNAAATLILVFLLAGCDNREAAPPVALALTEHPGQWVFINYWAPWCKPCIEEIPELNALHEGHKNITVYGVNFDGSTGEALREQEAQLGVKFPTLGIDPSGSLGIERPAVLPTTLVVDPNGALLTTLLGPQTEQTLLRAAGLETVENSH